MALTAPISTELQHDDIEIIDDLQITNHMVQPSAAEALVEPAARRSRDPLMPFLVLGILSWLTIIATASVLAF